MAPRYPLAFLLSLFVIGLVAYLVTAPQDEARASPQDFYAAINDVRERYGLPLLAYDRELAWLAQARADDMKQRDYFAHQTPEGWTVLDYMPSRPWYVGEIIGRNNYPESSSLTVVMDGFLRSPAHAEIIYDPHFTRIGTGIAGEGMRYYCAVFGGDQ